MANARSVAGANVVILLLIASSPALSHADFGRRHGPAIGNGADRQVQPLVDRAGEPSDVAESAATPGAMAESVIRPGIIIGPAPPLKAPTEASIVSGEDDKEEPGDGDPDDAASPFDERQIELTFWSSVRDSSNPADFEAYLETYPNGAFARLARNRLAALAAGSLPAETHSTPDTSGIASAPVELARLLQIELRRVGCNPGAPDGLWGQRSRRALEQFNRQAGTSLRTAAATAGALEAVRSRGEVCRAAARQPQKPAAAAAQAPVAPAAPAAQPRSAQLRSCTLEELRLPVRFTRHSCSRE